MFAIGSTKLKLDDAVGGEETSLEIDGGAAAAAKEDKTAKEMRKSLLSTLRNKFEAAPGSADAIQEEDESVTELKAAPTPAKKVARGATQAQRTPGKKAEEDGDEDDDVVEIKVDVAEEAVRPSRKKTRTG